VGLAEVVDHLACPVCAGPLALVPAALRCSRGHSFDIARQGYAALLPPRGRTVPGDTAAMVAARSQWLRDGHFDPMIAALVDTAAGLDLPAGCVVDVGAGPGRHLAAVLDRLADRVGVAIDVSVAAARAAARVHSRAGSVLADARTDLPLVSGTAGLALDVFAPRAATALQRVLAPGGVVLVVTPTPEHMRELVPALGLVSVDPVKDERLAAAMAPGFTLEGDRLVVSPMRLDRDAVGRLVAMGPSAIHVAPGALAAGLARLPERLQVTLSVRVSTWRRRS